MTPVLLVLAGCTVPLTNDEVAAVVFDREVVGRVDLTLDSDDLGMLQADPDAEAYVPGNFRYTSADGVTDLYVPHVGLRFKGNTSLDPLLEKLSWKVKFDQYDQNLSLGGLKRLGFGTEYGDPTFVREDLGYLILRENDQLAPRTQYVTIFVNDEQEGLYLLTEEIDAIFLFANARGEGSLYKVFRGPLLYWGPEPGTYADDLGEVTYSDGPHHDQPVFERIRDLADLLASATPEALAAKLPEMFDVDRWTKLLALETALGNLDSYSYSADNYYVYDDPESGKLEILPWDFDSAFSAFPPDVPPQTKYDVPIAHPALTPDPRPLVDRVLANEAWRQQYLDALGQFTRDFPPDVTVAEAEAIHARIAALYAADPKALYPPAMRDPLLHADGPVADPVRRYPEPYPGLVPALEGRHAAIVGQLQAGLAGETWPDAPFVPRHVHVDWRDASPQPEHDQYVVIQAVDADRRRTLAMKKEPMETRELDVDVAVPPGTSLEALVFVDSNADDGWIDPPGVDAAADGYGRATVDHDEATISGFEPWAWKPIWIKKYGSPVVFADIPTAN